jgi:predicted dehydrogenase
MRPPRSDVVSVLVGFGHAARSFHLPFLRRLDRPVHVVDPHLGADAVDAHRGPRYARTVAELTDLDPAAAVVHVCSPPDTHADVVFTAAELGFRRFIVEKPLATRRADAARLVELDRAGAVDVLVVANWLSSALTRRIRAELAAAAAPVEDVVLSQVKPRVQRTLSSAPGHESAFDVEAPHLVTLALALFDDPGRLREVSCTDLVVGDQVRPDMGSVRMVFRAPGGYDITLHSDLTAPYRERSTRIRWSDGRTLAGFHPCDSNDLYAQLHITQPDGRVSQELIYDDTVRTFLTAAYTYFAGAGPKPASDVHFGARVATLLDDVKSVAAAQKQPI